MAMVTCKCGVPRRRKRPCGNMRIARGESGENRCRGSRKDRCKDRRKRQPQHDRRKRNINSTRSHDGAKRKKARIAAGLSVFCFFLLCYRDCVLFPASRLANGGAQKRTRTSTVLPPLGPEPSASTNSAIWASSRCIAACDAKNVIMLTTQVAVNTFAGKNSQSRRMRKSTCAGRPGNASAAVAAGVRAMTLPARNTSSRVARRRSASTASPACSSTRSARQPGATP